MRALEIVGRVCTLVEEIAELDGKRSTRGPASKFGVEIDQHMENNCREFRKIVSGDRQAGDQNSEILRSLEWLRDVVADVVAPPNSGNWINDDDSVLLAMTTTIGHGIADLEAETQQCKDITQEAEILLAQIRCHNDALGAMADDLQNYFEFR